MIQNHLPRFLSRLNRWWSANSPLGAKYRSNCGLPCTGCSGLHHVLSAVSWSGPSLWETWLSSGYKQYFVKNIPREFWDTLAYSSPGAGWSPGEVLVFLLVQIWKCCQPSISGLDRENQGRTSAVSVDWCRINTDESERMWFQLRNSGKDLQTVMDTSIFCRNDFFCVKT